MTALLQASRQSRVRATLRADATLFSMGFSRVAPRIGRPPVTRGEISAIFAVELGYKR